MKLLLLITTILCAEFALADSFTIIRDGKEYLCEQRGPVDPGDTELCATKAYNGPFSREESIQLCAGARSVAPADCGIKAYNGPFDRTQAIQLCARARTVGPADCAVKAYNGPFDRTQAIELCRSNGSVANADCAIKAYNGPYSKEEAIRMCKEQPLLVLRSLALIEQAQELKPKIEAMKSKIKE